MFEQVRKASAAGGLILRADIVPDADGDDRRLVVLVDDDAEAVVEREGLVVDVDAVEQRLHRRAIVARARSGRRSATREEHANAKGNASQETTHGYVPNLPINLGPLNAGGGKSQPLLDQLLAI